MSTAGTVLYYAYGSNMLTARLRLRVPSAFAVTIGKLSGYRLCWHKVSRDGSGKCDVEISENCNDCVWGVIYEFDAREKAALDAAEGVGHGYRAITVEIDTGHQVLNALTYVATVKDALLVPYDWYKSLVIAGAREHSVPPNYVSSLEQVPSKPDCDSIRVAENASLLRG
jgi:gamma-glutamylcyclotransferase